jgi:hypothetical protein
MYDWVRPKTTTVPTGLNDLWSMGSSIGMRQGWHVGLVRIAAPGPVVSGYIEYTSTEGTCDNHSWAPMAKKTSIGSIPIID